MQLCSITTPFCDYAASQRQTDHISQTKIPNHLWKVKSHHWRPYHVLARKSIFFPFSIFKSSSKSVSFFVIEVSNLRCFSLKAYPQNFSDFASPSLSKICHRWKFSDLHVFFLFFFCFSDSENQMIFTLLVVFISLVLKWCSAWGIERFVNFENPFNL